MEGVPRTGVFHIGRVPAGSAPDDGVAERVREDWSAARMKVVLPADVMPWKYRKLLSNVGNAFQALLGQPRGHGPAGPRGGGGGPGRAGRGWDRLHLRRRRGRGPRRQLRGPAGTRVRPAARRVDLAVADPRHRQRRDRLPQRRARPHRPADRPRRPDQRHHGGPGPTGRRTWGPARRHDPGRSCQTCSPGGSRPRIGLTKQPISGGSPDARSHPAQREGSWRRARPAGRTARWPVQSSRPYAVAQRGQQLHRSGGRAAARSSGCCTHTGSSRSPASGAAARPGWPWRWRASSTRSSPTRSGWSSWHRSETRAGAAGRGGGGRHR